MYISPLHTNNASGSGGLAHDAALVRDRLDHLRDLEIASLGFRVLDASLGASLGGKRLQGASLGFRV